MAGQEAGTVQLEPGWMAQLEAEFDEPYMVSLRQFLVEQRQSGVAVYPARSEYFTALNSTPFDDVKVVILGQDPYHGPGQAHGLSFSVQRGVQLPPSLKNIYKELQSDLELTSDDFAHGCLASWAQQGVLLLNSVLTVREHEAGSHQGKGWERFTDKIIERLSMREHALVFMLWGSYAQKKGAVIDRNRHDVLTAPHPSPLSAYRGFFGCKHFSACNQILAARGETPIDWRVQ